MNNWFIKKCCDYHEICGNEVFNEAGEFKTIELGCFPTVEEQHHMYFGLFYQGRKPSIANVIAVLKKRVFLSTAREDDEDEYTLDLLTKEVRSALKV